MDVLRDLLKNALGRAGMIADSFCRPFPVFAMAARILKIPGELPVASRFSTPSVAAGPDQTRLSVWQTATGWSEVVPVTLESIVAIRDNRIKSSARPNRTVVP
jgi:hypothetical protein